MMFTTNHATPVRTVATAFAAAIIGTTTLVALSASPANAATPVAAIERQIAAEAGHANVFMTKMPGVATIAVRIDADGRLLGAQIARSSGRAEFDAEALRSAKAVSYPKGSGPRSVAVVMTFNYAPAPSTQESLALMRTLDAASQERVADIAIQPKS